MSTFDEAAAELRDTTTWHLANLAGVRADTIDGPEARFLHGVRDDFLEGLDYNRPEDSSDVERIVDETCHEWADGAVPIYTGERWAVFVGLSGWEVDMDDYGLGDEVDMTTLAGVALYHVAYTLIQALTEELVDRMDEEA